MMKSKARAPVWKLPACIVLAVCLSGCAKVALRLSPELIPRFGEAFFEECDIDLARRSLPAHLKLMEGLLKSDPENRQLLTSLCMGFTGYAMLGDEAREAEHISRAYLRARGYGLKALGLGALPSQDLLLRRLAKAGKEDLECLFWTTLSWNAWIRLNLDRPQALAQLGAAEACLGKVLEMDPDYFYGTPSVLMGSILAAKPILAAADRVKAKAFFERAFELNQDRFFLVHYYYARYYAVRVQDKALFMKVLNRVLDAPSDQLKEVCLINAIMKEKAFLLLERSEELFL